MLTVAYIGFGNSVCVYHLPYVQERPETIKVKYIFRREEDRVGDTERESWYPDIIFTSDIDEVMNDSEVNLIVVNTPNRFHAFYSKMALNHGKNVLCEKPFAESVEEAEEVFVLAKEKGLIATANQNRRFDADMRTLRKVLQSGVLGDIVEVQSHYDYFRPQHAQEYLGFEKISGVGVHPLDQMVCEFGVPKKVVYDCRGIAHPGQADDYWDIDLFYDGFKASVATSYYVKIENPRFLVHGTKGSFLMPQLGHNSDVKQGPGAIKLEKKIYPEEKWGTLSYINDKGEDITEKVPVELCDYGLIYDNINAVLEGKEEKLKVICKEQNIPVYYTDVDEMLHNADIDVVYIGVPNHLHYTFAKKALLAGKDVICEKPFTSNIEEARELIQISKEKKAIILEAVNTRYLPNALKIKEMLPQLGNLKIVSMNYSQYSSRYDAFKEGNVLPAFNPEMSGGALMDLNIYNINFAAMLFGKPLHVDYQANIDRGIDTSGILTLDYGTFKCVCIAAKDCKAPMLTSIQGDEGCVLIHSSVNLIDDYRVLMNKISKGTQMTDASAGDVYDFNEGKHKMYHEFCTFEEIIRNRNYQNTAWEHHYILLQI